MTHQISSKNPLSFKLMTLEEPDELAYLLDLPPDEEPYESFDVILEGRVHTIAHLKDTWWQIPVVLKFATDTFKGSPYLQPHISKQITEDEVKELSKNKIKIKKHWSAIPHGD